ncbi:MAG: serine hydrolase [Candidatus Bathyarchaeota archaeon]|nr:MAG: serine hydrolase [Candidatus Bathyarchaeota archaeon]
MIFVGAVTGGNLWLNRDASRLGYDTYSKYGISFVHPLGVSFRETVEDVDSGVYGQVQGTYEGVPEVFGVIWRTSSSPYEPGTFLIEVMTQAQETDDIHDLGPVYASTKDGDEMDYQHFQITETDGALLLGVAGAWYDEKISRAYLFYYISIPKVVDQQELEKKFRDYLDTFKSVAEEIKAMDIEEYWPTSGWRFTEPEDVGVESAGLEDLVGAIRRSRYDVDSVLVARNGYVVLDEYFQPFREGERHIVYSCTKSIVSTLIGIAIDKGYIEGVDVRVLDLFPDRSVQNLNAWKEGMTLRDLLTMTAGFNARDSYLYQWEGLERMHDSSEPLQYVLDLPVTEEPGTRFEYTNGVSHLLSCIISRTTGMSALEFAREHLFGPLGITDVEWRSDQQGRNWGYSSIYLTPHDMAKIGFLFLKMGEWDEEQIVPREWVEEATMKHVDATMVDGYGYQWWVDSDGYYLALGYKGQLIFVVPSLDLVVVFTGGSPETFDFSLPLIERYIIPAVDR